LRLEAVPALVIALGLLTTTAGALLISDISRHREHQSFESEVDQANAALLGRLETYGAALRAAAGLFAASKTVDRTEFRAFAQRVELGELYPGVQGIGYSARIPAGGEAALVADMRRQGVEDFQLTPRPRAGEDAHAILYLEPDDRRSRAVVGFNMYSDPVRREAMDRARDTGARALSGKVVLVEEIGGQRQAGFVVYEPIYRGGMIPKTLAERRELLEGFVYQPFRAGDLLQDAMRSVEAPQIAYAVYDGAPISANLLYRGGTDGNVPARHEATRTLNGGGRIWTVVYSAGANFHPTSDRLLIFAFVATGILASLLGAWTTEAQVRARLAAEREIEAREGAEERRKLLLDELNHRVKNTLATVQSIAAQSLRDAPDLETGRKTFEARLMALSQAHNLLTRDNWRGASLAELAATELAPYGSEGRPKRVEIFGEPVWLKPDMAVALGMAFHELATNAAKHGALSGENGRVKVSWTVSHSEDGPDRVSITWREAGGPPVRTPSRRGFGSRLIVSGLAHQLHGDVKLDFDPDGVRCSITFNLAPSGPKDAEAA